MKVRHLVSDRAKALIQLGAEEYLDVVSMPDLFHFNQTLARKVGSHIGKAWSKALKNYKSMDISGANLKELKALEYAYMLRDVHRRLYRKGIDNIHKTLHAFKLDGCFSQSEQIKQELKQSIHVIDNALMQSKATDRTGEEGIKNRNSGELIPPKDSLSQKDIDKLHSQIPDLLRGIQQWQRWTIERVEKLVNKAYHADGSIRSLAYNKCSKEKFQNYLLHILLPVFYWEAIRMRVPSKLKNRDLRNYYQQQIDKSLEQYEQHPITAILKKLLPKQLQEYLQWAQNITRSFQRASSKLEGRNGYLAFIHKANRGLSEQRLRVLTVIHNFDIRSYDKKTPAERLFKREFPDLFEFVLQNVTPFPEPRRKKLQTPKSLAVRA